MNERRCQVIVFLSKYCGDESAKTDRDMGERRRGRERERGGERGREREGERGRERKRGGKRGREREREREGERGRERGREREREREGERGRGREGDKEGGDHNIVLFVFLRNYLTRVRIEFLYSEHG